MKLIYFFAFVSALTLICCKKEKIYTPQEIEQQKLTAMNRKMNRNLVNDWKIIKIMTVKPTSEYGTIWTSSCEDVAIFSFKNDGTFNYAGNPSCYSLSNIPGTWELPKTDSLFIHFTGNWIIGAYENLEITMLTSDKLKWNILSSSATGIITQEYTLIPK